MYRVEYRLPGGMWRAAQLPSSLQVAAGLARAVKDLQHPQDVRIETGGSKPNRLVDILV